jgi:predicted regulator of Ras-like GTPase activity (Roadblock/LC7/MglB family)
MTPAQALSELTDLSNQVREAVLLERGGEVLASTFGADDDRAGEVGRAAAAALDAAARLREQGPDVTALEAAVPGGSLFVAAADGHLLAATTGPDEPAGLVLYDLRACLRRLGPGE